jgi:hypothetical protein
MMGGFDLCGIMPWDLSVTWFGILQRWVLWEEVKFFEMPGHMALGMLLSAFRGNLQLNM